MGEVESMNAEVQWPREAWSAETPCWAVVPAIHQPIAQEIEQCDKYTATR